MALQSHRGGSKNPQHLQIRSLWPDSARHQVPATGVPGGPSSDPVQRGFQPNGLPAFAYTHGQPSPRVAGQHWEAEFRRKLIVAVERRKRRAYLSIALAGSGVLLIAAFFATLISLQYRDGDHNGAEVSDALAVSDRPDRALLASFGSAPALIDRTSRKSAGTTRYAALDVSNGDQGLFAGSPPPAPTAFAPNFAIIAETHPAASISASLLTHTRLRIVGDHVSDPGAMIMIRGFPEGVALSEGMSPTPGTWVLGLENTRNLSIIAPSQFRGAFRARLEVIAAGGVSLGQQEVEINLPAATIVVAMPARKSGHRPRTLPQKMAPEQHAHSRSGNDGPTSATVRAFVPEAAATTQLAADDTAPQSSASPMGANQRRTHAQPAYGLGGPRQ